ncbi:asparagine--tRNA ligase, cytoplasmic 2-like isoform X2 [Chenopodium quinoa]|uniref:Aminoacyl-transfer RNA synthetases class-II family profile domain-containing protein n=1 Tax=Chenopodium quinoa TaxID=63459 RepID=A0A803KQ91_CHEQI|nr:asparagine--tRNA ligase, cytoplasmic 2-like isoform X2 [Chenopodium quinoa]
MSPKEEAPAAAATEAPKMAPQQQQEAAPVKTHIPTSKYSKRVVLKTLFSREDRGIGLSGERIVIGGWVKSSKENRMPIFRTFLKLFGVGTHAEKDSAGGLTYRAQHPVMSTVFLQISDGSCIDSLQVVVDSTLAPPGQILLSGTCILVEGVIQRPSTGGKHSIEVKAEKVLHLGVVEDHEKYPLSKKRLPLHTLRDWAHFRPRTTTVASITRIRHSLTHATHNFFQNNGFLYVQVPVITTTDSEGLSNKFNVTTLLGKTITEEPSNKPTSVTKQVSGVSLESIKASLKEKSNQVEELKRTDSNREALLAAIQDLKKTNELASQLEAKEKKEKEKATALVKPDKLDFTDDFFSCQAFLTVSGRLHLESYACALGNVYSFGPRFKAQTSHSTRHVSEMWMVEAEMAFAELEEAMGCATDLLKHLCKWVLEKCNEDMKFVLKRVDQSIVGRLQSVVSTNFEKLPYCKAIDILKQAKEQKFDMNVEWGVPLTEEHESYLADEIFKKPVIIYDYPKEVKPFYVRLNDDGKTVAAFDVIVPKVGAVIRGSQNEERVKGLSTRIKELGLSSEQYEWYLDLRRNGTAKHAGFSLTFDLIVLLATGISDIRDVVPFPRSYGKISN